MSMFMSIISYFD